MDHFPVLRKDDGDARVDECFWLGAIIPVRTDDGLDKNGGRGGREKWSDS